MAGVNRFELGRSNLNPFLFAFVGLDENGSPLTVLSMLARLGQDPWTEAGRWAALSRRDGADCLERSIMRMPLETQAIADSHATALRLIELLPGSVSSRTPGRPMTGRNWLLPKWLPPNWVPAVAFCATLLVGMMLSVVLTRKAPDTVLMPLGGAATSLTAPPADK